MTSVLLSMMAVLSMGQSGDAGGSQGSPFSPVAGSSRHMVAVSLGALAWPRLRDQERFSDSDMGEVGAGFGARYRLRAVSLLPTELLVGASYLAHASLGRDSNDTTSTTWSLTADLALQRAEGPLRPFLGGGVGYYRETIDDPGRVYRDGAWGGWAGLGLDLRFGQPAMAWGLFTELRVDFVDFGTPTGLAGAVRPLKGPIYSLQIGGLLGLGD